MLRLLPLLLLLLGTAQAAEGPIHGFFEAGFDHVGPNAPTRPSDRGYLFSRLDLFITPELSGFRPAAELILDASEGMLTLDLERMEIAANLGGDQTLHLGRLHTPLGAWNANFHGAQIQTAVYRPRFVDSIENTAVIPTHSAGLMLSGRRGSLSYDALLGSGSWIMKEDLSPLTRTISIPSGDMQMVGDLNQGLALGGRVQSYLDEGPLEGLTLGIHGLLQDVLTGRSHHAYNPDLETQTRVGIWGGYFLFENHGVESLGELYVFDNPRASWATFVQAAYAVTERLAPYARLERAVLDQQDPYFANQTFGGSYSRVACGARYNLSDRSSLKLEGIRTATQRTDTSLNSGFFRPQMNGGAWSELRGQWALRF